MGRNSGSKVFFTNIHYDTATGTFAWYCQQHAKFDMQDGDTASIYNSFITHMTQHGVSPP